MKAVGNKLYDVCADCLEIVQLNKTIFGDLHICFPNNLSEERKKMVYLMRKKQLQES